MPNDVANDPLDWTEANLVKVMSDIYAEAARDSAFYEQLMADPNGVLSSRIKVPEEFNGKVYARQKNKRMFIMNVPSYGTDGPADTVEVPQADYQILCTTHPPW